MKKFTLAVLTASIFFGGCGGISVATLPDGSAQWLLKGTVAEVFRKITKHEAITPSERLTIYGTENPPDAMLQCHEGTHRMQARAIADALVNIEAISDEPNPRMYAWLAIYGQEHLQAGYKNNRFEKQAREKCGI